MKKFFVLIGLLAALWAVAEDQVMVEVTGDRVSLRAAPDRTGDLLGKAELGEKLVLQDNTDSWWVGVLPPDRIDLWVHSEFVDGATVIPARLNIRSGPSLSHPVVGVIHKGEQLTVRSEMGGWTRIAPPIESVIWISRQYCRLPDALAVEAPAEAEPAPETNTQPRTVIQVVPAPEPEPAEQVKEPVLITGKEYQPEINAVMVDARSVLKGDAPLTPDPKKTQGAEWSFTGMLKETKHKVLSRLVDPDTGQLLICYVRGNAAQMKEFAGRRVSLFGRTYWALGLDRPFVVPVTLQVLED